MREGTLGSNLWIDKTISRLSGLFSANIQTNLIVPDISFYQESANFAKMKANGAAGVIIRAGQKDWPDTKFDTFWRDAKAAGLPRGTYFFFDSRATPESQADLFYSRFANDPPEMEAVVDYEESYGGSYKGWVNLYLFIERLRQKGVPPSKIAIYTGYYYWKANSPTNNPESLNYFGQYPLWLAWYTSSPVNVSIPAPWTSLLFWQFTSGGNGPAYGVGSGSIDLNYFNGTKAQFDQRYSGVVVPPPPPTEPPTEPPTGGNMGIIVYNNGVTSEGWNEYGFQIHAMVIPPDAIDVASFFYTPGQGNLAENLVNNDLKIFFNFHPFSFKTMQTTLGNKINGKEYSPYKQWNPWLEWDSSKRAIINHVERQWKNTINAAQGFRYIFDKGIKNQNFNSEWDQRYARQVVANDVDGRTIILTTTGERPSGGLTLHEVAAILTNWVADGHGPSPIYNALDCDSGHSAQIAYMANGEMTLFTGPVAGDRNQSVGWGFIRLKASLTSNGTPEPPPVEPPPVEPPPEPPPTNGFPDYLVAHSGDQTQEYYPRDK